MREFSQAIAERLGDKSLTVVVYCESGVRSVRAAEQLGSLGYSNVYSLEGGFTAWKRARNPVEQRDGAASLLALTENRRLPGNPQLLVFGKPTCV